MWDWQCMCLQCIIMLTTQDCLSAEQLVRDLVTWALLCDVDSLVTSHNTAQVTRSLRSCSFYFLPWLTYLPVLLHQQPSRNLLPYPDSQPNNCQQPASDALVNFVGILHYYILHTCVVKLSRNQFGDRSFATAGPMLWNSLLEQLQQSDITFRQFKQSLKTFMFG